jgi:hypothetical protein
VLIAAGNNHHSELVWLSWSALFHRYAAVVNASDKLICTPCIALNGPSAPMQLLTPTVRRQWLVAATSKSEVPAALPATV